jgi:tRNA-splicing ligase RtcB (3'-phosphate/5'-hydroxy nucleic acid ligase)
MKIQQIDQWRWRIPREGKMRVEGRIYASEKMIAEIQKDKSPEQVANVAHLPGILGASIAMPDMHWGYGFPIGGVAAFDPEEGVLSPGGVGYDINCGVRLIRSDLRRNEVVGRLRDLSVDLFRAIPSGVGSKSHRSLDDSELEDVARQGARWAIDNGYGRPDDLEVMEEGGSFAGADPREVSQKAKDRGRLQLGSLGSGNHFCELGVVAEIYDEEAAKAFGLAIDGITILIHSGSRGFGYQICDDSLHEMIKASKKYGIELPDRQLCAAPLSSPEAERYMKAMAAAINFAFANRQMMTHFVREALERFFGTPEGSLGLDLVYDVCHNIAKWETHEVDGKMKRVCVHRKGATRAFGAGHPDVPERYRAVGQPVLVPGDMGRYSYVLAGTGRAEKEAWGSSCHGAGRHMSRAQAKKSARGRKIFKELEEQGIFVQSDSAATVAEEISEAYKDVSEVVEVVHGAGLARKVAKLVPLAVIKG